ncbi:MAG: histone H1 [Ignavibacteria bacterium RBG_13_36_8]|nr:MAG: histone H1 [Ignavibacteria bacterium RBG_13_36_8]
MEKYHQLIQYLQGLETDVIKFYQKGQSAAGTRVRKGLSELKRMAQDMRNEVQTIKADRKGQKDSSASPTM